MGDISRVEHAGELYRVTSAGRVIRADGTTAMTVEPSAFREAQIIIDRIAGPFATAREAEGKAVAALREWNDRSRRGYWEGARLACR